MIFAGLYQLPVTNLVQPQNDLRLIRKLDATFLNSLKKENERRPIRTGVPPVAFMCITELLRESPHNSLYGKVLAAVYVGLQDKEALRLALCHNNNSHFIHRMSHKDYVS